jgi:hypothetical protein
METMMNFIIDVLTIFILLIVGIGVVLFVVWSVGQAINISVISGIVLILFYLAIMGVIVDKITD